MKICMSVGHGKYIRGASASPRPPYLDEVDEACKVVDRVAKFWRDNGVEVETFFDTTSTTQSTNLNTIVAWHNGRSRDYDVSCHFNAYTVTSKPMGCEVLYVTQQKLASDTSAAIARAGGFLNRGAKYRSDLAFLNGTSKPAILLETCFVDSSADGNLYRANFEAICQAIAEVVGKITIGEPGDPNVPPEPETPPPDEVEAAHVDIQIKTTGKVTITVNGQDLAIEEPGPEVPATPAFPPNQSNIICTVFGGSSDPNNSAYPPYDKITDKELSCALPARFYNEDRPEVEVLNINTGKSVVTAIRDIGPWNVDDAYWITGQRPQAESGTDKKGRKTNRAGIDLTPAAAKAIGLSGKGTVNWRFVPSSGEA